MQIKNFLAAQKVQKALVLLALTGAMMMAFMAHSSLTYIGILYYLICLVVVLKSDCRTIPNQLLWAAVGLHLILICYLLWIWKTIGIFPCFFCIAAAGFALIAATAFSKLPLSVIPMVLLAMLWYNWPY